MSNRDAAIDPDRGFVINSPEMKDQPLARFEIGRFEISSIPDGLKKTGVADSAERRLGRKRNKNARIPPDAVGSRPLPFCIQSKIPWTIQTNPILPPKLRARVTVTQDTDLQK